MRLPYPAMCAVLTLCAACGDGAAPGESVPLSVSTGSFSQTATGYALRLTATTAPGAVVRLAATRGAVGGGTADAQGQLVRDVAIPAAEWVPPREVYVTGCAVTTGTCTPTDTVAFYTLVTVRAGAAGGADAPPTP